MTTMTAADGAPLSGRLSGWRLLVSLAITILVVAFLMGGRPPRTSARMISSWFA